jgi:glycosyltransferase involved in cell wall biosynthesis
VPEQTQAVESPPPFPKVSVVIVSRNCAEALRRCLDALKHAQYRDRIEILVSDLASRDGCAQVDSEYEGVTVQRLPKHFGLSRARNIACRTATGEFLLLLSPAVVLEPPAIAAMAKALEAAHDLGAVAPEMTTPAGGPIAGRYRAPDKTDARAFARTGTLPVTADALLLRKSFLAGMNWFDEKRYAHAGGELELFRQFQLAGKAVQEVEAARAVLHPLPDPDSDQAALFEAERLQAVAAFLGKHYGFAAGLAYRLSLTFENLAQPSVAWKLILGQRVDGTQG